MISGSPVSVVAAVTLGGKLRTLLATESDPATQMHSLLTSESRVRLIMLILCSILLFCLHR